MPSITSETMLNLLYERKLPQVYRYEDSKIKLPLKRYLESLIEGGYCGSIEDIEGMLSLIDPMTIPDEYFPYLCESFGLTYFPDIDISYQRKFLANIGEINKRRGTFSCVQFLIKVLTGLNCDLSYYEGEYNGQEGNYLFIDLQATNMGELNSIDTSMAVIGDYIRTHIPYYVSPVMSSSLAIQVVGSKSYSLSAITQVKSYTIR